MVLLHIIFLYWCIFIWVFRHSTSLLFNCNCACTKKWFRMTRIRSWTSQTPILQQKTLNLGGNPFKSFDASNVPKNFEAFHFNFAVLTEISHFMPHVPKSYPHETLAYPIFQISWGYKNFEALEQRRNVCLPATDLWVENNPFRCNESPDHF